MAEKYLLSNGVRLLIEYMPQLRSVATGIWADVGSAREEISSWGAAHLLEHMLFKGTPTRSSLDISATMDNVGGVLNAFTGKERTCYYTRCLDEHFELSLSLLADMYINALLDAEELEREKTVVEAEINMYEDSADDVAADLFASTLWPNHPLGRTTAGTVASVSALDRPLLAEFRGRWYAASDTVLAIAGNIAPARAVELAEKYLAALPAGESNRLAPPALASAAGLSYINKDIEQNHICLGFPSFALTDDDYYAGVLLSAALGGGASARLFQEVREKRGLSYAAYSYLDTYCQGGYLMAYAATQPDKTDELMQVLAGEFARLRRDGLRAEELTLAQQQLRGATFLQMENTGSVMTKLGKTELTRGLLYDPEHTSQCIMAVTMDDIQRVIERLIVPEKLVCAQVGPEQAACDPREVLS